MNRRSIAAPACSVDKRPRGRRWLPAIALCLGLGALLGSPSAPWAAPAQASPADLKEAERLEAEVGRRFSAHR